MNGGDYPAVWQRLLDLGCSHAAAGFIEDMFTWLAGIEAGSAAARDVLGYEPQGYSAQELRAVVREQLMEIIGDRDGLKLREWLALFGSDRDGFAERAELWVSRCLGNA